MHRDRADRAVGLVVREGDELVLELALRKGGSRKILCRKPSDIEAAPSDPFAHDRLDEILVLDAFGARGVDLEKAKHLSVDAPEELGRVEMEKVLQAFEIHVGRRAGVVLDEALSLQSGFFLENLFLPGLKMTELRFDSQKRRFQTFCLGAPRFRRGV